MSDKSLHLPRADPAELPLPLPIINKPSVKSALLLTERPSSSSIIRVSVLTEALAGCMSSSTNFEDILYSMENTKLQVSDCYPFRTNF